MISKDFLYENQFLSNFGYIMCSFNGASDVETVLSGSNIEFQSINPAASGNWHHYASTFTEPMSTTFQIGKFDCTKGELVEITSEEISTITRWLKREDGYHKFAFCEELRTPKDVFFKAKIDVSSILISGKCYGFELTVTTNNAYAFGEQEPITHTLTAPGTITIVDNSDRIGHSYPNVTITVTGTGADNTLKITNSQDPTRYTEIKNCIAGETITLNGEYMVCTTTATVGLEKRFNYRFPKIMNTYSDRNNVWTVSLPCEIRVDYNPAKKIGLF